MRNRMEVGLKTWMLGAAATGLLTVTATGQSKNVASSNAKKSVSKPTSVVVSEPPELLPLPTVFESSTNAILTASQVESVEVAANEKSEVQRQLEMLYEKDGREMPDLKLNLQPLAPAKGSAAPPAQARTGQAAAPAQKAAPAANGYTKYQPAARPVTTASAATPATKSYAAAINAQQAPPLQTPGQPAAAAAQPRQSRVAGFFKRFVPAKKPSLSTPPVPPDYMNSPPDAPPASMAGIPSMLPNSKSQAIPVTPPAAPLATKPVLSGVPLQSTPVPIAVGFNPSPTELPQPTLGLPPLAQQPLPLATSMEPSLLPPLMTEPQSEALAGNEGAEEPQIAVSTNESLPDFPDPFVDSSANRADVKGEGTPLPSIQPPALSAQAADNGESAIEVPDATEDPFAVREKDFTAPALDEKVEAKAVAADSAAGPKLLLPPDTPSLPERELPKAESTTVIMPPAPPMPELTGAAIDIGALKPADDAEDACVEKMRRIRDRFGMKGLKGFCPVTLRDERELLDAKPEFFYTHRGQKFHFASAEARAKFESDPAMYAPAAYGADVVALGRDKDVVEGTLDFAAWFKGRLYLFGSQANYDVFVKSPVTYASPAGIE
jgi:YHS domain-containing protein